MPCCGETQAYGFKLRCLLISTTKFVNPHHSGEHDTQRTDTPQLTIHERTVVLHMVTH